MWWGGRTLLLLAVPLLVGAAPGQAAAPAGADDFVVVVNADNPLSYVPRDELSRLYLKKSSRWRSGEPALPVDLAPRSPVRVHFSRQVLGKSVASVKAYWQQQIFSGRGVPPPEQESERQALDYVRDNPAAVAYVSVHTPLGPGVRVIAVTDR